MSAAKALSAWRTATAAPVDWVLSDIETDEGNNPEVIEFMPVVMLWPLLWEFMLPDMEDMPDWELIMEPEAVGEALIVMPDTEETRMLLWTTKYGV